MEHRPVNCRSEAMLINLLFSSYGITAGYGHGKLLKRESDNPRLSAGDHGAIRFKDIVTAEVFLTD